MKQAINQKLKIFLGAALYLSLAAVGVLAQPGGGAENEPASASTLLGAPLPANARRVLPSAVPAEVDRMLDQLVADGNGQVERGDSEVIVWAGAGYKKTDSPRIIRQLHAKWKSAGWTLNLGEKSGDVTHFSLQQDVAGGRAVVGFYRATKDALLLALTELRQPEDGDSNADGSDGVRKGKPATGITPENCLTNGWMAPGRSSGACVARFACTCPGRRWAARRHV